MGTFAISTTYRAYRRYWIPLYTIKLIKMNSTYQMIYFKETIRQWLLSQYKSFTNICKTSLQSQKQSSRGVLRKRCSKNMQQIYRRTAMQKCDLGMKVQSNFSMGVLLWICCIFSEHLFLRTPLDGYFWQLILNLISTYFRITFSLFTCWKQKLQVYRCF